MSNEKIDGGYRNSYQTSEVATEECGLVKHVYRNKNFKPLESYQ